MSISAHSLTEYPVLFTENNELVLMQDSTGHEVGGRFSIVLK